MIFNNNVSGNERFTVCDTAADGNAAYVEYRYNNGANTQQIVTGGNGTCGNFTHNWAENNPVQFKSCERRNNLPDDCSSWINDARS